MSPEMAPVPFYVAFKAAMYEALSPLFSFQAGRKAALLRKV
jgi:hypothetical protein